MLRLYGAKNTDTAGLGSIIKKALLTSASLLKSVLLRCTKYLNFFLRLSCVSLVGKTFLALLLSLTGLTVST